MIHKNIKIYRSFFQSVCVLGYCLLPTAIALILCRIILIAQQSTLLFTLRCIISEIGFLWATYGKHQLFVRLIHIFQYKREL